MKKVSHPGPWEPPSSKQHHCPFTTQMSRSTKKPRSQGERGTSPACLKWRHLFFLCSPPPNTQQQAEVLRFPSQLSLLCQGQQHRCACSGVSHISAGTGMLILPTGFTGSRGIGKTPSSREPSYSGVKGASLAPFPCTLSASLLKIPHRACQKPACNIQRSA